MSSHIIASMSKCETAGNNPALEQLRGRHSFQDACLTKVSGFNLIAWIMATKRHAQMIDRLGEQLAKHKMLEKGRYTPLSEFKSGIFCPDQYPHGTIIRVRAESLYLHSHDYVKGDLYGETRQFGFVVDTRGIIKNGRNAVVYLKDGIVCGGDFQNIKIGETRHQKMNSPEGKTIYNLVEKINSVEIVLPGSGMKEKRRVMVGKPRLIFAPGFQI
jgi:hypothetical protein